jgi:hypothetical protein
MELIFEVRDAEEGGYCARALGHAIFTQAETWEELRVNVPEAASLHFEAGQVRPSLVQDQPFNSGLGAVWTLTPYGNRLLTQVAATRSAAKA